MAKQTFTAGQVLTATQMNNLQANDYNWTTSAKTASYILAAADAGTTITMTNAGSTTITVNTSLFTAGDTVRIINLGAGTCTITAGTASVNSAGSLAIPQYGSGTLWFSSASASIWIPDDRTTTQKIAQVVTTTKTDTFTTTSTSNTDVTGLSVTITPTSATSTILVFVAAALHSSQGIQGGSWQLVRGSTAIALGDAAGSRTRASGQASEAWTSSSSISSQPLMFVDSPATTSATTYKIQARAISGGTILVNRSGADSDNSNYARFVSTITVVEITA
jgi:hypothetical protein